MLAPDRQLITVPSIFFSAHSNVLLQSLIDDQLAPGWGGEEGRTRRWRLMQTDKAPMLLEILNRTRIIRFEYPFCDDLLDRRSYRLRYLLFLVPFLGLRARQLV